MALVRMKAKAVGTLTIISICALTVNPAISQSSTSGLQSYKDRPTTLVFTSNENSVRGIKNWGGDGYCFQGRLLNKIVIIEKIDKDYAGPLRLDLSKMQRTNFSYDLDPKARKWQKNCLIPSVVAQKRDFGNNMMGDVLVVGKKNGIIKLSIFRKVDYSAKYNGTPSQTITYVDCNKKLEKDTRWDNTFRPIDRQSAAVAYYDAFC
jgi:hypothetical protein